MKGIDRRIEDGIVFVREVDGFFQSKDGRLWYLTRFGWQAFGVI